MLETWLPQFRAGSILVLAPGTLYAASGVWAAKGRDDGPRLVSQLIDGQLMIASDFLRVKSY
jgi:hypothetical protein